MKLYTGVLTTIALALSGSLASAADAAVGNRVSTDFNGKPPFKRQVVAASTEEGARSAAVRPSVLPAAGDRLHVAQFRARPPFARQIVEIDANNAVEFARFEEVETRSDTGRRFGAPGKGHR